MAEYYKEMRKLVGHRPLMLVGSGVILFSGTKLLLQRRADDGCWGKHGGVMDYEENAEDACRREVYEEIGLSVGKLTLFGVYTGKSMTVTYPNGDIANYTDIVYVSDDFQGELSLDRSEVGEVRWFEAAELPENIHPTDRAPVLALAAKLLETTHV